MGYSSQFDILFNIPVLPHCYTPAFVLCSLLFSELKLHLYTNHDSQIQAFYSHHLYLDVDHYGIVILQDLCTICWTSLLSVIYSLLSLHVYRLYNLIILINVVRLVIGSNMYILHLFLELLFSSLISFYS